MDRGGVNVSVNPAEEKLLNKSAKDIERTTNAGIPELQQSLISRVREAEMVKCWEAKNCEKSDCPSHGSDDRRCWLHGATFCYNKIQGTFKQKRAACERCEVFLSKAVKKLEIKIGKQH